MAPYLQYSCWTVESLEGMAFDMRNAIKILDVTDTEYGIGRRLASRVPGGYELRGTSGTINGRHACHLNNYLFYNRKGMGRTGVVARWKPEA